jgi:hypothetical protein
MKSYVVGSNSACRIARDKLDIHADGSEQIQPLGSEFRSCQLSTKQTQLSLLLFASGTIELDSFS